MVRRGVCSSLFVSCLWAMGCMGAGACSHSEDPIAEMLSGKGRVLLGPGFAPPAAGRSDAASPVPWERAPSKVRDALEGGDAREAARRLREAALSGLLLGVSVRRPAGQRVIDALSGGGWVRGWRGVRLRPEGLLFEPGEPYEPVGRERDVIGQVARGILEGRRPPRITSFPEPWRRIRSSEVMVAVRDARGVLRLWRSARASSMARALLTAASVARQRWMEREEALGGAIESTLPGMRVEVTLLWEDGTIEAPAASFVDRMVSTAHGVGFEQGGGWHYVLPEAMEGKRPFEALMELLDQQGLGRRALERSDVRVYRFVPIPLAVSEPDALLR